MAQVYTKKEFISMIVVLRIERIPFIRVNDNDPLCVYAQPVYIRPSSDRCLECVCVEPSPTVMRIEINGQVHSMIQGTLCKQANVPADAVWHTVEVPNTHDWQDGKLPRTSVVYARCDASMRNLDKVYRQYVNRYPFKRTLAIKSVAGSGKTTTLLNLAKQFKEQRNSDATLQKKRILYVAFNKQLVDELRGKLHDHGLSGVLVPMTFDALVKRIAEARFEAQQRPFHLVGALTPVTLTDANPWFQGKPYAMKKGIIKQFCQFCQHPTATHPNELFPKKAMLAKLWQDTIEGTFLTFDGLRKRAHLEHWMRGVLDDKYARIFVDEAQDFDPIMLDIVLNDASCPKVFVGDPRQQIYEWRGTINAFDKLPPDTLILEFYSTFRMGEPATSTVAKITKTPMFSGATDKSTHLTADVLPTTIPPCESYTYLFRSWRCLLTTAKELSESLPDEASLWIHEFDKQMQFIERLHERLNKSGSGRNANQRIKDMCPEDDELPSFLMKLTHDELMSLKNGIQSKRAPRKAAANVRMYTIHAFKGLEADCVRVANDVDRTSEPNLYYVALTRGITTIYVDKCDESAQVISTNTNEIQQRTISKKQTLRTPTIQEQLVKYSADERKLAEALIAFRKRQASQTSKPAYTVFTNKVLFTLVEEQPANYCTLKQVRGVGDKLVTTIGKAVLELISEHNCVRA